LFKKCIKILILSLIIVSCNNKEIVEKKLQPTQLDSLLHFDTIVTVYSHSGSPIKIAEDEIEEEVVKKSLWIDSVNKWTESKVLIDSIKKIFPCLTRDSILETLGCDCYAELFIETKHQRHTLNWINQNGIGTVLLDSFPIIYKTNLNKLNTIRKMLDRKIIRKEITAKDSIKYNLNNTYNKKYLYYPDKSEETMYVYILK